MHASDVLKCEFTRAELYNFLMVLRRGSYTGLDEAEVAVNMARKIEAYVNAAQPQE